MFERLRTFCTTTIGSYLSVSGTLYFDCFAFLCHLLFSAPSAESLVSFTYLWFLLYPDCEDCLQSIVIEVKSYWSQSTAVNNFSLISFVGIYSWGFCLLVLVKFPFHFSVCFPYLSIICSPSYGFSILVSPTIKSWNLSLYGILKSYVVCFAIMSLFEIIGLYSEFKERLFFF
jgi:hypothetical protein